MAGVLDKFLGGQRGGGGKQGALLKSVMGMLGGGGGSGGSGIGGLSGLLGKFRSKGMGDKADSWVRRGENRPVSGREVREALGDDEVRRIASESGMPEDEAADEIARVLPDAVDEVTPEGQVPDDNTLQGRVRDLTGKLFG